MPERDHPHVCVVTFHDLGRFVGPYAAPGARTPAFDQLAAQGATFERAFASAPQCSPSRASLATGLHPQRHGVLGLAHEPFCWDLAPGVRHVAQHLGELGYDRHLFGFQHVTMHPERLGFETMHGREPGTGLREVVPAFVASVDWSESAPPRYVEVNVEEPHRPYGQDGATPVDVSDVAVPAWLPDTEATRTDLAALHGAVSHADATLGAILDALDAAGAADRTVVIACADHGIAMPRAKCTLSDVGLEIALLVRWPGRIAQGTRIPQLTSNVDVLPTLLELAGCRIPDGLDGRSHAAALLGSAVAGRAEDAPIFAQKTFHTYFDPMRCVRTSTHKLIRNFDTTPAVEIPLDIAADLPTSRAPQPCPQGGTHPPIELYDLQADPHELRNLADSTEHQQVRRELDAALLEWMRRMDDPLLRAEVPTPPALAARVAEFLRSS